MTRRSLLKFFGVAAAVPAVPLAAEVAQPALVPPIVERWADPPRINRDPIGYFSVDGVDWSKALIELDLELTREIVDDRHNFYPVLPWEIRGVADASLFDALSSGSISASPVWVEVGRGPISPSRPRLMGSAICGSCGMVGGSLTRFEFRGVGELVSATA